MSCADELRDELARLLADHRQEQLEGNFSTFDIWAEALCAVTVVFVAVVGIVWLGIMFGFLLL